MRVRRPVRAWAAILLSLSVAAGAACSPDEASQPPGTTAPAEADEDDTAATAVTPGDDSPDDDATDGATATPSPEDDDTAGEPIAVAPEPINGYELALLAVHRTGEAAVSVEYRVTNVSDEDGAAADFLGMFAPRTTPQMRVVSLVDEEGGKRYLALEDSEGFCLCSSAQHQDAGESVVYSTLVTSPPPDVDSVTVLIGPYPPFADVTIDP